MKQALMIAWREMRHEWLASLCFVAALAGGLAPLLVVLSLKNGVIEAMVDRLVEDPANRELIAVGAGRHDAAFFELLRQRPDVAFAMPATRSINAQANALRNSAGRETARAVTLIGSGEGDPLLAGAAPFVAPGGVVLSETLAKALQLQAGGQVEILIARDIDGRQEAARADLKVLGVLPAVRYPRAALFLALPDLLAVEMFRDDPAITPSDWRSPRAEPDSYASFRLYARRLEDLTPLAAALRAQGVETRPRAQNAALLLGFRDTLGLLYALIAALAVAGFWAAMAANLRAMVARQRVSFSLLSLIGMANRRRRLVPMLQSLILVMAGIILTLALVLGLDLAVNRLFESTTGETVARLRLCDIGVTLLLGIVTAVTAALWAVRAIDRIGAEDVLREG